MSRGGERIKDKGNSPNRGWKKRDQADGQDQHYRRRANVCATFLQSSLILNTNQLEPDYIIVEVL